MKIGPIVIIVKTKKNHDKGVKDILDISSHLLSVSKTIQNLVNTLNQIGKG